MPSPFPGMNPYLEQDTVWHDFHESFIPAAREMLIPQVRPHYIIKIDEHVYIHELPENGRSLVGRPDLSVAQSGATIPSRTKGAILTAPSQVRLPTVDFERLSFLEIRDRDSGRVVTVLELLSPSNKQPGSDREQYLAKRARFLTSPVHFVEIDLLRGGPRLPLENLAPCDYYALVGRVETRPDAGLWPIKLRDRLPEIPIPLQSPHPDARLDLQEAVNRIYDAAGYEDFIYRSQPQPPLSTEDTDWATRFLPSIQ